MNLNINKVAIIIPTMNRTDFILRTVRYYASINSTHPIYIGDASDQSSEQIVLDVANDEVEVHYFHWKGLSDRKTMVKLAEEASIMQYGYCAFHGDDDYFIPDSLSKCADFLKYNPDYATAQGKALLFSLDRSGPYGNIKGLGVYWNKNELRGDSAKERLKEITNSYWVPIFSVHRTDEYIEDIANGIDTVIDRNFGECINVFTHAMRGKSRYVDCLYLIRNGHDRIEHPSYYGWISSVQWHPSLVALLAELTNTIVEKDNLSKIEGRSYVENSLEKHLDVPARARYISKDVKISLCIKKITKKIRLELVAKKIRKIIFIILSIFPSETLRLESLTSRSSKYYKDFMPIMKSLQLPR